MNKITVLLIYVCLLFSQNTFAARMGGGRSYGMQRSNMNYNTYRPQPQHNTPQQPMAGTQPRRGMGAGTGALLGAAAGAAGGYMLGRSMSNQNASGITQNESVGNNIPWGTIAILVALLLLGLMLFRKSKTNPRIFGNTNNSQMPQSQNIFKTPTINNSTSPISTTQNNTQNAQSANTIMEKMPDGIESIYFLRQVKGTFLHIQSMNNLENVSEIEKYMTPELYQEMKRNIASNTYIADFQNLECQLLNCEIINNQVVASVKFFGLVSEEPNQIAQPFSEIWNFVKSDMRINKWLVAGIQQETLS